MLCGGLGGTLAAAVGVPASAHFALVAGGGLLLGQAVARGPEAHGGGPLLARPSRRLLLLGALAFTAFLMDGAASDWSAIQVRARGGSGALAAAGFAAFALAPLAPAVMRAAGPAPADIPGVTTLGYLGSFSGPAAVGGLAALAGLPVALTLIAAAGLAQATAVSCATSASIVPRPGRAR